MASGVSGSPYHAPYYAAILALGAALLLARPFTALPLAAAALAVLAGLLYPTFDLHVLRPWLMLRRLKAQGVPGYPFRPVVGNLPEMFAIESARMKDPDVAASTRATQFMIDGTRELGRFWTWSMGTAPRVVLSDPSLVRCALVTHSHSFQKPREVHLLSLLAGGLASSEGTLWSRQKRLLTPAFHFTQLRRMLSLMAKCTQAAIAGWAEKACAAPGVPLEMDRELCNLTLQIIVTTAFGAGIPDGDSSTLDRIQDAFNQYNSSAQEAIFMSVMLPLYPYLPTAVNRRLWGADKFLRETTRGLISERVKQAQQSRTSASKGHPSQPVDLLQLMLDAREEGEEPTTVATKSADDVSKGLLMSEQQIMAECLTFFFAGHETTARLLSWTMVLLSQHKEWQDKAREEVMELRRGKPQDWVPDFDDLGSLKVVTWVLQEVLRLFPPASMVVRMAAEDTKLSEGLTVPEGCTIVIPIEVIHQMEEFWGPDAAEFNPQRFAEGASRAASQPGAYIPFGVGPRLCIGQNLAMMEAKLILVLMLLRFSWTTAESYQHYPSIALTTKPKHGVPLVLTQL